MGSYDLRGGEVFLSKDLRLKHKAADGRSKTFSKEESRALLYYLVYHPEGQKLLEEASEQYGSGAFFDKVKKALKGVLQTLGPVVKDAAIKLIKEHGAKVAESAYKGFTGGDAVDDFLGEGANSWSQFLKDNKGSFKGDDWHSEALSVYRENYPKAEKEKKVTKSGGPRKISAWQNYVGENIGRVLKELKDEGVEPSERRRMALQRLGEEYRSKKGSTSKASKGKSKTESEGSGAFWGGDIDYDDD